VDAIESYGTDIRTWYSLNASHTLRFKAIDVRSTLAWTDSVHYETFVTFGCGLEPDTFQIMEQFGRGQFQIWNFSHFVISVTYISCHIGQITCLNVVQYSINQSINQLQLSAEDVRAKSDVSKCAA